MLTNFLFDVALADLRYSFGKGNIAWINISQINAEHLQLRENAFNLCPSFTENLGSVFLPLCKNLFAEVSLRFIKTSVCKVQYERRANNRHLYRAKFIINLQQSGYIEPEDSGSSRFAQTLIDPALTPERVLFKMKFYREKSWISIVFDSEDGTMDAKTQPFA